MVIVGWSAALSIVQALQTVYYTVVVQYGEVYELSSFILAEYLGAFWLLRYIFVSHMI